MANCVNFCNNKDIITNYDNLDISIDLSNDKTSLLFDLLYKFNISLDTNNILSKSQFNNFISDINTSFKNIDTYAFLLDTQGVYYAHGVFNDNNNINLEKLGTLLCENNVDNLLDLLYNKLNENQNNNMEFVESILLTFLSLKSDRNLLVNAILNILQQSINYPKLVVYNWISNSMKSALCVRLSINNKIYVLCV